MKHLLALVWLVLGSAASAATVSFSPAHSYEDAGAFHYFGVDDAEKLGQVVRFQTLRQAWFFSYMANRRLPAGRFDLIDQSGQQHYAFSLDPNRRFALATQYETAASLANETAARRMQRLVDLYYRTVDTDAEAAAFQMAVWEIAADAQLGATTGRFRSTGLEDQTVASYFAAYLAGVAQSGSVTKSWELTYYEADEDLLLITIEDLLPPEPVPVPPLGYGLAGLAALWLRARRG